MAKDSLPKKRKTSVPEQDATKLKKPKKVATEDAAVPAKKRKATEDAAPAVLKKSKTPKSTTELTSKPSKKETTSQKAENTNGESIKAKDDQSAAKKLNGVKGKSAAISKKDLNLPTPIDEEEDDGQMADEEAETSDFDDQTDALLKGFESDGDEDEDKKEGGLEEGQPVPGLELSKKKKKQLKKALGTESVKPGTVYVGRIPHGFYEKEMKEYFEQFGKVLKLRLSRNPKNGASRHYAFVQFESDAVADVVARTMDGYLMFNHILKVKLIPDEQAHDDLFKGANKRFKKVPWNKIRGRELDLGQSEVTWDKRKEKEEKRREVKGERTKAIGYEFEAPAIKSAKGVAKPLALENGEGEQKAIEAPPADGESSKSKKRKAKKAKAAARKSESASENVEVAPVVTPIVPATKPVKEKKEAIKQTATPAVETPEKPKNDKKVKPVETPIPVPTSIFSKPKAKATDPVASAPAAESSKPKTKTEQKVKSILPEAGTTEVPEKTLKKKKSKTGLTEEAAAGDEKKKSKKAKSKA